MAAIASAAALASPAGAQGETLRFALTPVFLTSDLALLEALQAYLSSATGRPVELITRRTYQEVTGLLIGSQADGAWLCGFPYVQHRAQLELLAVPVWRGQPLYQSYLISTAGRGATSLDQLRGDIHAFSDPDSNSGYLVTAAELARSEERPDQFFKQSFFTYSHFNVVRAVASGLAQSGSVDGYVYEVLKETNPELTGATEIVRPSEWFGFPPIVAPTSALAGEKSAVLRQALLDMHTSPAGRLVLDMLRLDKFESEPPALFASIEDNWDRVRELS
ncbi:PhnD/SsuA/transferrin family substrate-binding protein [Devosia sp. 66-22]|uniref:substrate-binding domain-containing protein n=1 Tax=Devosia sp. 66-22 TaxID=1895753 RepID=UPI000925DE31|nr:PhnD/SsuA/transferrin family substrate-binding protein [Devosia sp. 66-22]OJX47815.1 MAG: phosphonate ABC transporter substrate-binding protein [Devosia sp. 66-22]